MEQLARILHRGRFDVHRMVAARELGVPAPGFRLFPDAEIAEDHVEQILDLDGTGDMAEAAQCQAQVFRAQLGEHGHRCAA